ncbi:hypothetical protein DVH24_005736 [Malus domestica]|uniref:Uncharacterized protein n=1 Tax=Malus domestica TaxID=3750 RepID=A0A498IQH1_MALDO|nr:hypothetical protein DVH24_005736 [Malus domestica]
MVHELSIRRVANQGVKDLEGLIHLIGCEVTLFTKKDLCLITGLYDDEPYDLEVEPSNIRLLTKYFPQKFGFVGKSSKGKGKVVKGKGKVKTASKKAAKKVLVTCAELETTFKQCEDEDDALKMGLVYFVEGVLIGVKREGDEGDGDAEGHEKEEEDEKEQTKEMGIRKIVPTEVEKNSGFWTWGYDADVVMLELRRQMMLANLKHKLRS